MEHRHGLPKLRLSSPTTPRATATAILLLTRIDYEIPPMLRITDYGAIGTGFGYVIDGNLSLNF